jgi:hypothetical protein
MNKMAFIACATLALAVGTAWAVGEELNPSAGQPPLPEKSVASPFKTGVDLYLGLSDRPGNHRYRDGMWAGQSNALPSSTYIRWDAGKGQSAKFSLGTGRLFTSHDTGYDQPAEAWVQQEWGHASLRLGKFWVPFASQEWELETKPGAMLQWNLGKIDFAASGNYNTTTRTNNGYARIGHAIGKNVSVGLSGAAGRGLTYNTSHNLAWAADACVCYQGWQVSAEYLDARGGGAEPFKFAYGKLGYDFGKWKPWVGLYGWKGNASDFGEFHSNVMALGYELRPGLVLEAGTSTATTRNTSWLQLHWTSEY